MKNKYSIKEYSLLGVSFLLTKNSDSEIIYTDIDDVIIDISYEEYLIDLDNNDLNDFKIYKYSGIYVYSTSLGFSEIRQRNVFWIKPDSNSGITLNEIAGYSYSTNYSNIRYWPYALQNNSLISSAFNFNKNDGVQIIASRLDIGDGVNFVYDKAYGYWWPITEDHYLGLHFIDADSNFHYGWVRCSVLDSSEVLVIKDFAYESEIDHPIIAGDTLGYVDIDNLQNTVDATIYSFQKNIYVNVNNNNKIIIAVLDINGKELIKFEQHNNFEVIDMHMFPIGIYFVTVKQGEKCISKTVLIQQYN